MIRFLNAMALKNIDYDSKNSPNHYFSDDQKLPKIVGMFQEYSDFCTENCYLHVPKTNKTSLLKTQSVYLRISKNRSILHIDFLKFTFMQKIVAIGLLFALHIPVYVVGLGIKIVYFSIFPGGRRLYRAYLDALKDAEEAKKWIPSKTIQKPYVVDSSSDFTGLHVDVKLEIFSFLDSPHDVVNLSKTCKSWNILSRNEKLLRTVPKIVKDSLNANTVKDVFLKNPVRVDYVRHQNQRKYHRFSVIGYSDFGFDQRSIQDQPVSWGLSREGFIFLIFQLKLVGAYRDQDYLTFIFNPKEKTHDLNIKFKYERGLGSRSFQNHISRLLRGEKICLLQNDAYGNLIATQASEQSYIQTSLSNT